MESAKSMEIQSGSTGRVPACKYPANKPAEGRTRIERRKHIRYGVKDLILVKLRSKTGRKIGQLLDISEGGLSFYYFVNTEKSANYSELEIRPSHDEFAIEEIPFRTISDTELNYQSLFSIKILRRQGLQFLKLTREQKARLDYFLDNYTVDKPAEVKIR